MQTLPSTVPVSCVLGGGDGEQKSRDPCDCGFADVCVFRPEPCLRLFGCSGAGGHIWLSALAGDASLEQSRNCRQCYGKKGGNNRTVLCPVPCSACQGTTLYEQKASLCACKSIEACSQIQYCSETSTCLECVLSVANVGLQ